MANSVVKNGEKATTGVILVAAATLVANAVQQRGVISQDMQPYAVTILSGLFIGAANFIKYTIKEAVARRRARKG